jgi:hypothetical protein
MAMRSCTKSVELHTVENRRYVFLWKLVLGKRHQHASDPNQPTDQTNRQRQTNTSQMMVIVSIMIEAMEVRGCKRERREGNERRGRVVRLGECIKAVVARVTSNNSDTNHVLPTVPSPTSMSMININSTTASGVVYSSHTYQLRHI